MLRRLFARFESLLRSGRADRELEREIASHLLLLEEDFRRRGLSAEEARRAARLALGGIEQTRELHREARSVRWIEDLVRDGQFALRLLRRDAVVGVTVVLSVGLGIGASAAIFAAGQRLLFRAPAGIFEPDQLVDIGAGRPDGGVNPASYPAYLDVRDRTQSFAGVFARQLFPTALALRPAGADSAPERVFGQFVSPNYFAVLGVRPAVGTLFAMDPTGHGEAAQAVLSHACWIRRFAANPEIVGRGVVVNGRTFTVVGVTAAGFSGTDIAPPDLWLPLDALPATTGQPESVFAARQNGWLMIGARLRPDVPLSVADAEVSAAAGDTAGAQARQPARLRAVPSSAVPGNRGTIALFLTLLMGLVVLVVSVACANVSGVLLARATARRREMAMRLALGASRARLMRQLLAETAVLFLLACIAGLVMARIAGSALDARLPAMPFPVEISLPLDAPTIAFAAGFSLLAAVLCGLAPALQASREQPLGALKETDGSRSRLRQLLVVAQIACSVTLVIAAVLFARAIAHAGAVSPGFDPQGVELVAIDVSMAGYLERTGPAFWRTLVDRVRALPGIERATVARVVPGGFEGIGLGLGAPGARPEAGDFEADGNIVEPGYFETLRIPLRAGRDFTALDRAGTEPVAIVGEAAARHFWPGEPAVGKYLSQRTASGTRNILVVGVAADISSTTLVDGMSQSFVYLPLQQAYAPDLTSAMTLVVRTRDGSSVAPEIRHLVGSLDSSLPPPTLSTLHESIALGLVPQRVAFALSSGLGTLGVLLAMLGIYGVTAFTVGCRRREFAIRRALGAQRLDIGRIVAGQALRLVGIGSAVGAALAAATATVLSSFLLGVPALDPLAFGGTLALFALVGTVACVGPVRRAVAADPLALRSE